MDDPLYASLFGKARDPLPHWEHWSCPDAETYLTGIDYYDHPRLCRQKLNELYPLLELWVPPTDEPKPRPVLDGDKKSSLTTNEGLHMVRWGDGTSSHWDWGVGAKTPEDVFAFSPLSVDLSKYRIHECRDYRDEEKLYEGYRKMFPDDWTGNGPEGKWTTVGFYNTMFMWPLLSFGWELFLECCLDRRFERIMNEFAEINRRVFRCFARLPVNAVICHDDIVTSRGPVCSPTWMHKYVFPRYQEYWGGLKAAGKKVIFMVDGCIDAYADDVFACGADGIITEPHTHFKQIARKHPDKWLAGEGDNRVLTRDIDAQIKAMVRSMVETAKMTDGRYAMCVGNHIPWNVTPEGIKRYLDYSAKFARI